MLACGKCERMLNYRSLANICLILTYYLIVQGRMWKGFTDQEDLKSDEGFALNMDNYHGRGFQGLIAKTTKERLNNPGRKVYYLGRQDATDS